MTPEELFAGRLGRSFQRLKRLFIHACLPWADRPTSGQDVQRKRRRPFLRRLRRLYIAASLTRSYWFEWMGWRILLARLCIENGLLEIYLLLLHTRNALRRAVMLWYLHIYFDPPQPPPVVGRPRKK